jgi:hypothetical protein
MTIPPLLPEGAEPTERPVPATSSSPAGTPTKKKVSSVRHTRAVQRARSQRPTGAPPDAQLVARLTELIQPATFSQVAAYQAMGLRARVLTLPVMVAFVLSLIWRQLGSVSEAVRVLREEGLLWTGPLAVSQPAASQRLRVFPAALFARVLDEVLPQVATRARARTRPVPPALARLRQHFDHALALDGSTLDVLLRKVGLLRAAPKAPLAGRMGALLDVLSHLPVAVWYEAEPTAHDQRFWPRLLDAVAPLVAAGARVLLVFDLGYLHHAHFDDLSARGLSFLTRAAAHSVWTVERPLRREAAVRDTLIRLGTAGTRCTAPLRLIELRQASGSWYRYLTNILDPAVLRAEDVAALYAERWRIEDAFAVVKRLLGLAYFYTGAANGVQVQLWATWLLYAVLVDLTDAVAEALQQPLQALSLEMVYRGLYHFSQAFHRGQADDPVTYLAAKAQLLGILKRRRSPRSPPAGSPP